MKEKLFDTVSMAIDRAIASSGNNHRINNDTYTTIKNDCIELDIMNDEFDFDSFEIMVNENSNKLAIKIITPDITFNHGRTSPFFDIITHTSMFMFSSESKTDIGITLVYENIMEV